MEKIVKALVQRAVALSRRPLQGGRFKNVSFLPLPLNHHPAFDAHEKFLQNETAYPLPGKVLHVINRRSKYLVGFSYLAEVENLFALLPKTYTRSEDFKISEGVKLIEAEIRTGKLKKIVFQSESQYRVNQKWFTPAIDRVACVAQIVPDILEKRTIDPNQKQLKVLVIGGTVLVKGLFMLPGIVREVRKTRPDIHFTLVTPQGSLLPSGIDGLEILNIPRSQDYKKLELLRNHHFFLNLSLGDALGVFLECAKYNLPMITFPGQHGPSFVPEGAGRIIKAPCFSYDPIDFDRSYNLANQRYADYIDAKASSNFFRETEIDIAEEIARLELGPTYEKMVKAQHTFCLNELKVSKWLDRLGVIYSQL